MGCRHRPSTCRAGNRRGHGARTAWFLLLGTLVSCGAPPGQASNPPAMPGAPGSRPKVLYVDSYDADFSWVRDIMEGLAEGLQARLAPDGTVDASRSPVELRVFHMDSKQLKEDADKQAAADRARDEIERWQPDLVIVSDDNAAKYLVHRYYRGSGIPVVFCGVNWEAEEYGFPCPNITGMLEVQPVPQVIEILRPFATGDRIGILASDTLSERKTIAAIGKAFGYDPEVALVDTFADLRAQFTALQERCDMVLILEVNSVAGFDEAAMRSLVAADTVKPTGAMETYNRRYVVASCAKTGQEQGRWAARTALRIINGTSPGDIPIARNHEARITLNMPLAKKLGMVFPPDIIEQAEFVE